MKRLFALSFVALILVGVVLGRFAGHVSAQLLPTSTPLPVIGATSTPIQVQLASITPPAPVTTPTPTVNAPSAGGGITAATGDQRILIEPLSEVNVRSSPEITEDNRIGAVREGDRLVVLGRYFNWIEFQYDQVPSGRGWIYADLVEVIQGDEALIPVIELGATPTEDTAALGATETRAAVLAAPGGALTVTAQARVIQLPEGTVAASGDQTLDLISPEETPLPTYTFPPNISFRVTEVADAGAGTINRPPATDTLPGLGSEGGLPPIVWIAALGGLGVVGLLVSLLRG